MPETWSLRIEKALRPMVIQNPSLDLLAEVENLECGQIYWIDYRQKNRDLSIPNFVPTAYGVDMGRIYIRKKGEKNAIYQNLNTQTDYKVRMQLVVKHPYTICEIIYKLYLLCSFCS